MKKSPLQLNHYHYNKLLLEVNAEYAATSADTDIENGAYLIPAAEDIKAIIKLKEVAQPKEAEPPFYVLEFSLSFSEKDFPYTFAVGLLAFINCNEKLDETEEMHKHRLVVNAVSMLFSAVKDQLLTLSSRQQYGPMMLPSLDFRALVEKDS